MIALVCLAAELNPSHVDAQANAARRARVGWMVRPVAPMRRERMLQLALDQGEGQAELMVAQIDDRHSGAD